MLLIFFVFSGTGNVKYLHLIFFIISNQSHISFFYQHPNAEVAGNVKPLPNGRTSRGMEILGSVLTALSVVFIVLTFPQTIWKCARIIREYERAVVFRLGRLVKGRVKGPGLLWFIPWLDEIQTVDLRTVCLNIEPQQVMTVDAVPLRMDAVVFYRVVEPALWVIRVQNGTYLTQLLAQTTLRATVGSHSLHFFLDCNPGRVLQEVMDAVTKPWGVKVQRVELRGLALPRDLLRCMALEAEAHRQARAKLISAQGELSASRALREAASSLSPIAFQLRYLQSLSSVDSSASVIVTALPTELVNGLLRQIA
uniref:Podocin n=1 Tax=Neogobius melanostomus TaxID=47308 RepID=A0A8C6T1D1_9GOBI